MTPLQSIQEPIINITNLTTTLISEASAALYAGAASKLEKLSVAEILKRVHSGVQTLKGEKVDAAVESNLLSALEANSLEQYGRLSVVSEQAAQMSALTSGLFSQAAANHYGDYRDKVGNISTPEIEERLRRAVQALTGL
jgi:hypothetical protein